MRRPSGFFQGSRPLEGSKRRCTLRLCNLDYRSVRIQNNGGSALWILPGVWDTVGASILANIL